MGGRGGSSGLKSGFSDRDIARKLPDEKEFKIEKAAALEGSEKQIKWANDIRKSLAVELGNYATSYTDDGKRDTNNMFKIALGGKESMVKDIKRTYEVRRREPNASTSISQAYEYNKNIISNGIERYKNLSTRIQRFNQIAGEKSAKWWIENRYNRKELQDYIDGKRKKP